ncbi:MAG: hypothetical protein ABSD20_03175 [Terriglobales bacterium]|jgi:hypothetical protein
MSDPSRSGDGASWGGAGETKAPTANEVSALRLNSKFPEGAMLATAHNFFYIGKL